MKVPVTLSDLERQDAGVRIFLANVVNYTRTVNLECPCQPQLARWHAGRGHIYTGPPSIRDKGVGPQHSQKILGPLPILIPFDQDRPDLAWYHGGRGVFLHDLYLKVVGLKQPQYFWHQILHGSRTKLQENCRRLDRATCSGQNFRWHKCQ